MIELKVNVISWDDAVIFQVRNLRPIWAFDNLAVRQAHILVNALSLRLTEIAKGV